MIPMIDHPGGMINIGKSPVSSPIDSMPSIPAYGPPERRGEGRRPVGPSAFASVRLPRSRHRFVPAPAPQAPPEPSLRGAVRSSPVAPLVPRAAPPSPGRRKRLPLRGFLKWTARSGTCFAPAPLRSGTASPSPTPARSSPEPSSAARSLRSLLPRCSAFADTGFVRAPARSSPEPSLRRSRLRLRM